ncbi:unnamed protein product [Spodoptera littoralis]|uniref:Yellow-f4 n=1 Tax=Spodoptera littoralis TaxID=7109 RepID=A0A9P0IA05_SPOLI|nr:unnamed protein product [Spodoptera littoralis]CAH1642793.1 unnamed protein product [Spodoptera littoralis]
MHYIKIKAFPHIILLLVLLINVCKSQYYIGDNRFKYFSEVFSWKQINYDFDGVLYTKDEPIQKKLDSIFFRDEIEEKFQFFKQYNNIPIGFEVYNQKVFITVPRRRYGIPSTLNVVPLETGTSPLLKPYPNTDSIDSFVSVYRPRVDSCKRLWMVDTGLIEVPNNFEQKRAPQIIIYDLETDTEILRHEIPMDVLVNGTTSGLTSITVDVLPSKCDDAYAYINDLARNGIIVFSLKQRSLWRISHQTFNFDIGATNFTVAHHVINWKDGLFSVALSDPDNDGKRTAYYHPFISTQEYSVSNEILKDQSADFAKNYKLEGVRGAFSQSGSHDFHSGSKALFYANVAQDGVMCWNTKIPLTTKTTIVVAQSHTKLVYISDLKVIKDEVWVLVDQIPVFIYSQFNITETNFYVHKAKISDLIKHTVCDK